MKAKKSVERSLSSDSLSRVRSEVDAVYSFQNVMLDRLIQHLNETKKMSIVTKAVGKAIILNDYDGMRREMESFIREVIKLDTEIKDLKQERVQIDTEINNVKQRLLDLRFIKSIEESRIRSKRKYS